MPKIIKNNIIYGASSAMVEMTQAEYNALSSAQKNNGTIYLITDANSELVLGNLDDVTISAPAANQFLVRNSANNGWKNESFSNLTPTTITVTAGSSMPSGFPTPTATRRGNVCIINFAIQIPAGTYANTDVLWNVSPLPIANSRCMVAFSANANNFTNLNILNNGTIKFNGAQTVSSDSWLIGQCVYLTDGATS